MRDSEWYRCCDCGQRMHRDEAYCGFCENKQKADMAEGENDGS